MKRTGVRLGLLLVCLIVLAIENRASAQVQAAGAASGPAGAAPILVPPLGTPTIVPPLLSQAPPPGAPGGTLPVDLTPVKLPERGTMFDTFKADALYRLPARMFFTATCENSIRLETNVFQTLKHNKADLIYRVLPNVTLGYALTRTTRISSNYFFLRDQYADHPHTLNRNFHSIGFTLAQDIPVPDPKTLVTASFFGRELFITHSAPFNDLIPSIVATRVVGPNTVVYGSILGQIRYHGGFLSRYQEFDQFYSAGAVYRRRRWTFSYDTTFITNFGRRKLREGPNNAIFVLTLEAARPVMPRLPLSAFLRIEPIFNIGANQATGFAGVNVRVFGGLRAEISKPTIFPVKVGPR